MKESLLQLDCDTTRIQQRYGLLAVGSDSERREEPPPYFRAYSPSLLSSSTTPRVIGALQDALILLSAANEIRQDAFYLAVWYVETVEREASLAGIRGEELDHSRAESIGHA